MKDGMYVVKSWEQMESDYGLTEDGDPATGTFCWYKTAESHIPIHRTIEVVKNSWDGWGITEEMLIGPAIKPGTMVEVSDDNKSWISVPFSGYSFEPNIGLRISAGGFRWTFIRLIDEPKAQKMRPMTRDEATLFVCQNPTVAIRFKGSPWHHSNLWAIDDVSLFEWCYTSPDGFGEPHKFEIKDGTK